MSLCLVQCQNQRPPRCNKVHPAELGFTQGPAEASDLEERAGLLQFNDSVPNPQQEYEMENTEGGEKDRPTCHVKDHVGL